MATHSKDSTTAQSATANTKKSGSSRPSSVTKTSPSPVTRKVKQSFWQSLVSVLLPCTSPKSTARAHDIEVDEAANAADTAAAKAAKKVDAVGEKGTEAEGKKAAAKEEKDKSRAAGPSSTAPAESSSTSTAAGATTATTTTAAPSTPTKAKNVPANLTVPHITTTPVEQNADSAVVVPPSPHSHLLPHEETEGVTSGAVQPPGSTGGESSRMLLPPPPNTAGSGGTITSSDYSSEDATFTTDADDQGEGEGDHHHAQEMHIEEEDDEEERLILQGGTGIPIGPDGQPCPLLPPVAPAHKGRKCLVLDLDETLLHSSFKLIPQADYVVPVEIEWQWHNVYVIKRPGVDNFLKKMGEIYEVVIFTASLSKYADPVLDKLDVHKVVAHRLFRESCYNHRGNYVKDLSRLGRPVEDMIILDNSPASYIFHPNNAVPVSSWFNDPHDTELTDLCPFLTDLTEVADVRGVLDGGI
ncbi:hypothetical protein M407DRAFT_69306 [Tulasnella calospora MUT 4182]|uniref:FCP1 homology domain-containing protein n=1 Tax=Tulasnella calospora MUT 4182 TaxID=1051891 RepID=A0A0C3L945_9AGAM|nr:hypothetical protein M407DRAFT_69306 [Tulasnella calospora MUT 4182]